MTDRPIIFSAPMVRALLDTRKTQTRRVLKPQPEPFEIAPGQMCEVAAELIDGESVPRLRLGRVLTTHKIPFAPGDRLYVREGHMLCHAFGQGRDDGMRWGPWGGMPTTISPDKTQVAYYRASFERCDPHRWRPSIHMPRWASRLTLTVTDVRVQRLQEISRGDAMEEGCPFQNMADGPDPRGWFRDLWNSLRGPDAWDANPWVAALTFTVEHRNIDTQETANA